MLEFQKKRKRVTTVLDILTEKKIYYKNYVLIPKYLMISLQFSIINSTMNYTQKQAKYHSYLNWTCLYFLPVNRQRFLQQQTLQK